MSNNTSKIPYVNSWIGPSDSMSDSNHQCMRCGKQLYFGDKVRCLRSDELNPRILGYIHTDCNDINEISLVVLCRIGEERLIAHSGGKCLVCDTYYDTGESIYAIYGKANSACIGYAHEKCIKLVQTNMESYGGEI